jgi:UPF0176 protein
MAENKVTIITFYKFVNLLNCIQQQDIIKTFCLMNNLRGTVLLASEGINATLAGSKDSINKFIDYLIQDNKFADIHFKKSLADFNPFRKIKVRLKKEIVKMGIVNLAISKKEHAKYIEPDLWDGFMSDADAIIDVRNIYEISKGAFVGSINPLTKTFYEFPLWAKKWTASQSRRDIKLGMLCTGGIRCEKAASYLNSLGFRDVYQLKGGALEYLKATKNKHQRWMGECFVFDDRIAVDEGLQPSNTISCNACANVVNKQNMWINSKGRILCIACQSEEFANFFSKA